VGGIKTNLSLFRRILSHPDFRAAKLDTGFLDRMLKRKEDQADEDRKAEMEVAAIAAGVFAGLGSATAGGARANAMTASKWKSAARVEAVESKPR
jgi:acetyl-CoA carboxylase, biotin carboxylase subunit